MLQMVFLSAAWAQEILPEAIIGTWQIELDNEPHHHIEIFKSGDHYCGKIVWLRDAEIDGQPRLDEKNKDESLRERPVLGLQVLSGYKYDHENVWTGGKLYAFEKGRTVSPRIKLIDEDHIEVRIKILFFKKTLVWKRLPIES